MLLGHNEACGRPDFGGGRQVHHRRCGREQRLSLSRVDVVAPISGADDRNKIASVFCHITRIGEAHCGHLRPLSMWSPRFRGRTTVAKTDAERMPCRFTCGDWNWLRPGSVVAPISGADDRSRRVTAICRRGRGVSCTPMNPDVVAPISGADDRKRCGEVVCVPDVVAPSSGGGRQRPDAVGPACRGCGRPDFGGGRQCGRLRLLIPDGCGRPDFGGADDREFAKGTEPPEDVVAPIPGADNERNGRAGRRRSSLEAGGSNGPGHRTGTKNGIDDRRRTSAR